ncbi:MAG: phage terminase large subunit [Sphingomonadaceae bacterium]
MAINERKLLVEAARTQFSVFVRLAFMVLRPHETFLDNWHIQAICHELERTRLGQSRRLMVSIPPRHLKSLLISVIFPAWLMLHNPGAKILCLSYARELATAHARDFQKLVLSAFFRRLAPKLRFGKFTEEVMETSAGGARYSRSIEGSITGFGGQFVIIDDPLKAEDAASKVERDGVNEAFSRTVLSRPDNKATAAIILVMQRLHPEDLIGYLLSNNAVSWQHLNLPAIAEAEQQIPIGPGQIHIRRPGDILHPARDSKEVLAELQATMLSDDYAAQYQQAPVPAGGVMLRREWIRHYDHLPDRSQGQIIESWDTALTNSSSADYSVCTTWLLVNGQHFVIDRFRGRLEFPDLLREAKHQYERHRPDRILIEAKGSGISLAQTLRHFQQANVVDMHVKDDKVTRLNRVLHYFEQGTVFIPQSASWTAELEEEWLAFPNGRHDDQVDSMSQYLTWYREKPNFEWEFL